MKLQLMRWLTVAAIGSPVAMSVYGAAGDERFTGGSHDGYDQRVFIQCDSNTLAGITARNKGGSFDGYASNGKNSTSVASGVGSGTLFIIR